MAVSPPREVLAGLRLEPPPRPRLLWIRTADPDFAAGEAVAAVTTTAGWLGVEALGVVELFSFLAEGGAGDSSNFLLPAQKRI